MRLVPPSSARQPNPPTLVTDSLYRRLDEVLYEVDPDTKLPRWNVEVSLWGRFELLSERTAHGSTIGSGWQLVLERVNDMVLEPTNLGH